MLKGSGDEARKTSRADKNVPYSHYLVSCLALAVCSGLSYTQPTQTRYCKELAMLKVSIQLRLFNHDNCNSLRCYLLVGCSYGPIHSYRPYCYFVIFGIRSQDSKMWPPVTDVTWSVSICVSVF